MTTDPAGAHASNPLPFQRAEDGRIHLSSPTALPRAGAYLWNPSMLVQVNCRGFVVSQYMHPEPQKYSRGPALEATTFMQPEMPYYAHHPGRFLYIKDEERGLLFSAPYEPVRDLHESFRFSVSPWQVAWTIVKSGLEVEMRLCLPTKDAVEMWELRVRNLGFHPRRLSLYPYFSVGYMSWMNQSAEYVPELGAIVARSVTPYQRLEDYPRVRALKDLTFLAAEELPDAWETSAPRFEGEGGLHCPEGIAQEHLSRQRNAYDLPVAVLQYRRELPPGATTTWRLLFGPARRDDEIRELRQRYLSAPGFERARREMETYSAPARAGVLASSPVPRLDHFVNDWLSPQIFYHGRVNRLTTDPQTRNYLQDAMGRVYLEPQGTRAALLFALGQQRPDGGMPDGILLRADAELKYINKVPHTDHCVWLPLVMQVYLDETGDWGLLREMVTDTQAGTELTVLARVGQAMRWLMRNRDHRGLSYIAQGDWCDPMNMVGPKGLGVSGWLTMATVYALNTWAQVCTESGEAEWATELRAAALQSRAGAQTYLWHERWFARGITDAGTPFGVPNDVEGRIFLNPQSWAMLADVASEQQRAQLLTSVKEHLDSPYGTMVLAPAYTSMREDVGRVTQKHPGSAENGSVYNHAAMFFIFALYRSGEHEEAFRQLMKAIPGATLEDTLQRGQLPNYLPNYYRGAIEQFPETAGRSSHLFNTGAASWLYRIVIEELYGLRGCRAGLRVSPKLPVAWKEARLRRRFREATLEVRFERSSSCEDMELFVDGERIEGAVIPNCLLGTAEVLDVRVVLPEPKG